MSSEFLAPAFERLASAFPDHTSLIAHLPLDAVLARAKAGEIEACVHRLVELTIDGPTTDRTEETVAVFGLLGESWPGFSSEQKGALTHFATQWWESTLGVRPEHANASDVLACLCRLPISLAQWEQMWLADLDEAPAAHLVNLILRGLDSEPWFEIPDARHQVQAWTESEPVLFGLAMIAGAHLADGELERVLDRLVDPDS